MKYVYATVLCLLLAAGVMVLGPRWAVAADAEVRCITPTQTEFLEENKDHILKLHVVPDEKLQVYLTELNIKRAAVKMFPMEADIMLLGELKQGIFGIVLFKDHCVVPGSIVAGPIAKMFMFLKSLKSESILSVVGPAV